jgi:hypothetical protein
MKHEDHCKRCEEILGKPFKEVHLWLDELFHMKIFGPWHRCVRHNWEGIAQVKAMWGDEAAEAAKIHIMDDLRSEGGMISESDIAKDQDDYKRRGYF